MLVVSEETSSSDPFPNTRWSLILLAQKGDESQARKALSELFEMYWHPVYHYVRFRGYSPHDAEDLTQAFFESLLMKESLRAASREEGKLRSFLLSALKNFLVDAYRRQATIKRGGRVVKTVSHEDAEKQYESAMLDHDTPELLFERSWAQTVIQDVMGKLRASYERADRMQVFDALSPCLLASEVPPYLQLCKNMEMSGTALRVQYHRMKQRFGELLEIEIRHTVNTEEEMREERDYLIRLLCEG